MTVIGVAGCTALLVVGWGIKDSIKDVVAIQFGELYNYNFACPDVAVESRNYWANGNDYSSIFNVCCYNDLVPYVPGAVGDLLQQNVLTSWGKYGCTKWYADDWDDHSICVNSFEDHLQPNYLRITAKKLSWNSFRTTDQTKE